MNCSFRLDGSHAVCTNPGCDRKIKIVDLSIDIAEIKANCKGDPHFVKPVRSTASGRVYLGTAIKEGLDSLGITQDRVEKLVASIGLPPTCLGCAKRKDALDEFHRHAESWLKKAAEWIKGN